METNNRGEIMQLCFFGVLLSRYSCQPNSKVLHLFSVGHLSHESSPKGFCQGLNCLFPITDLKGFLSERVGQNKTLKDQGWSKEYDNSPMIPYSIPSQYNEVKV